MKTEQALDLAYDNPFTCITTESLYDFSEGFFYYDLNEQLHNSNGDIIQESEIYSLVKGSDDEEFNDWIEIDVEIPEKDDYNESYNYYGDFDE